MVLTADSILARSTRRRQTSTGWNTAYIGANRYTLPPDEKPPADDALHPMSYWVEPMATVTWSGAGSISASMCRVS